MSLSPAVVTRFIVEHLAADGQTPGSPLAGIALYDGIAPEGSSYPLVQIQHIATTTKLVLGGRKLWDEAVFQVEAFGRGTDITPLIPIADRVDDVLHLASGTTVGGQVVDCVSEMPIKAQDAPA